MKWMAALLAPLLVGGLLLITGSARWAIGGYHVGCVLGILLARRKIRPFFQCRPSVAGWALGTTVLFFVVLWAPLLVWDPRTLRASALAVLFPGKEVDRAFVIFAAYTMMVHCPLEEIFWRGAVLDSRGPFALEIGANGLLFYLVHAAAMAPVLGLEGWLLALPAGLAGGGWSYVTLKSRSLWPALISHWVIDAAILGGMWYFFVRGTPGDY